VNDDEEVDSFAQMFANDHETAIAAAQVRRAVERRMDKHQKAQMVADALAEEWAAARCVISFEYPHGGSINFKGERNVDAKPVNAAAVHRAPVVGAGEPGEAEEKRPLAANDRNGPVRVPDSGVD
jgi:hypothetical protein